MNYYNIKPLEIFLRARPPTEPITREDLIPLLNKVERAPLSPATVQRQKKYAAALRALIAALPASTSVPHPLVRKLMDRWLRAEKLIYIIIEKSPVNARFSPKGLQQQSDYAFYSPWSRTTSPAVRDIVNLQNSAIVKETIQEALCQPSGGDASVSARLAAAHREIDRHVLTAPLRNYHCALAYFKVEETPEALIASHWDFAHERFSEIWEDPAAEEILRHNSIMIKIFLQELVRKAAGKRVIILGQYGFELADGFDGDDFAPRPLISKENLTFYQRRHKALMRGYAQVKVGDWFPIARTSRGLVYPGYVVKKSPKSIMVLNEEHAQLLPTIYNYALHHGFRAEITEERVATDLIKKINLKKMFLHSIKCGSTRPWNELNQGPAHDDREYHCRRFALALGVDKNWYYRQPAARQLAHRTHLEFYRDLVHYYYENELAEFLQVLNNIFDYMVPTESGQEPEKIKYLQELRERHPPETISDYGFSVFNNKPTLFGLLGKFLEKFNYHKKLLEKYPALKIIPSPAGALFYYRGCPQLNIIPRIPPPEINELAWAEISSPGLNTPYPIKMNLELFQDAEKKIPRLAREVGLTVKKTLVTTKRPVAANVATGWEITAPPEEPADAGIVVF